jgi:phosphoserine phosphatase RsbU/P
MRTLLAEDDVTSRVMLSALLKKWGFDPVVVEDGIAACEAMQRPDSPKLAILDWNMPKIDGLEVCRRIRKTDSSDSPVYIIMLTSRGEKGDIVLGLEAGANDYISKPYDQHELRVRLEVGRRMVTLQTALVQRIAELKEALDHVKILQGFLPICSYCKKIRDDKEYWHQVENYISTRSEVEFSHSICPDCYQKYCVPMLEKIEGKGLDLNR